MKNLIVLFSTLTMLLSCGNDNEQDKSIITENATIYYYLDPEFGGSQCSIVIETLSGNTYIPKAVHLPNFSFDNQHKVEVEVSYRLTEDSLDRCRHKGVFLDPITIVEIISIKKR